MKNIIILGVSAFYHDSAAALIINGEIVAAAEEERLSRIKHDSSFPVKSIKYCLNYTNLSLDKVDYIIYYEDTNLKLNRIISTMASNVPFSASLFSLAISKWLSKKKFIYNNINHTLSIEFNIKSSLMPKYFYIKHHRSHAASAFFPSPYKEAIILCADGVGEWETTSIWYGYENKIYLKKSINFPNSIGLLYSAFTYYLGFKVNSGEYKLMGLAPYGEPKYVEKILDNLVFLNEDGSFELNMDYFSFPHNKLMITHKFSQLFGMKVKSTESIPTQKHMDIAISIQKVIEQILINIVNYMYSTYKCESLCMAGGVALNCVANSKILQNTSIKNIWIQPAAGDSGCAIGAALSLWHEYLNKPRISNNKDKMKNAYLGPSYNSTEIKDQLNKYNAKYERVEKKYMYKKVAKYISDGLVIGWFSDRMEFGPRALGNRSILGDPRSSNMQSLLNQKIKKRESFRPFAPIIKYENMKEWFDFNSESPYMLFVADVKTDKRMKNTTSLNGLEKLKEVNSIIPAITHVDYSARLQTITKEANSHIYLLIDEFEKLTGCPILINTSFNERGEPIVCTPKDAYYCFMRTDMDILVIQDYILYKKDQDIDNKKYSYNFEKD